MVTILRRRAALCRPADNCAHALGAVCTWGGGCAPVPTLCACGVEAGRPVDRLVFPCAATRGSLLHTCTAFWRGCVLHSARFLTPLFSPAKLWCSFGVVRPGDPLLVCVLRCVCPPWAAWLLDTARGHPEACPQPPALLVDCIQTGGLRANCCRSDLIGAAFPHLHKGSSQPASSSSQLQTAWHQVQWHTALLGAVCCDVAVLVWSGIARWWLTRSVPLAASCLTYVPVSCVAAAGGCCWRAWGVGVCSSSSFQCVLGLQPGPAPCCCQWSPSPIGACSSSSSSSSSGNNCIGWKVAPRTLLAVDEGVAKLLLAEVVLLSHCGGGGGGWVFLGAQGRGWGTRHPYHVQRLHTASACHQHHQLGSSCWQPGQVSPGQVAPAMQSDCMAGAAPSSPVLQGGTAAHGRCIRRGCYRVVALERPAGGQSCSCAACCVLVWRPYLCTDHPAVAASAVDYMPAWLWLQPWQQGGGNGKCCVRLQLVC
jgi:hypothetical protein